MNKENPAIFFKSNKKNEIKLHKKMEKIKQKLIHTLYVALFWLNDVSYYFICIVVQRPHHTLMLVYIFC